MSKVFSISMAMALMLMSLMGPMQPADVMDDAPQDPNPMAEEMPSDDTSETDDVVADEEEETQLPPTEEEQVTFDDEDLTPAEEPAENANSPPAEDEPVVEEEPLAENDTPISPNAVDPNPGDCPVDEICDGGGGGEPIPQMVDITFRVMGNSSSGNVALPNATVTIYQGSTHVLTQQTSSQGTVSLQMKANTEYRVSVSATGYISVVGREVFPFRDATIDMQLQEAPAEVGTVTFHVTDIETGDALVGAYVRISEDRTWNHKGTGQVDSSGTWTTQELPHGAYVVDVWHTDDYYSSWDIEISIPVSGTVEIQLESIPKSPISLKFVDAITGDPVEGAFFYLYLENNGSDVVDYSPASGEYVTEPLEHGNYGITVRAEGYGYVTDLRWGHPHTGTFVIEMQPLADGTITIIALDEETREPIANANITLYEGEFDREVVMGQTGPDGMWTSPELPGGYYAAAIYPAEHYARHPDMTVVSGNSTYELLFMAYNDVGWMDVNVTDSTGRFNVAHAKITVREQGIGGIITTGTTDGDGFWRLQYLPSGSYEFTVERTGFVTKTVQLQKSSADTSLNIELSRSDLHSLRFWLVYPTCCSNGDDTGGNVLRPVVPGLGTSYGLMPTAFQTVDGTEPVVGAHAMLIDPMNRQVVVMKTSDSDGLIDMGNVYGGTYILQIYGGPFEEYTQEIDLSSDLELTFLVGPADDDPGTGNPGEGNDPGTGNPGEGTDPGTGNPGDGTDPGTGNPGTGNPGAGTNPNTGNPDEGTNPGSGTPDEGTNPVPGGENPGQDADADNDNGVAGSTGPSSAESVARSSDATVDTVNQLPNTGSGESGSHIGIAVITLMAAFSLLSALGIRRKA